MFRVQNAHSVTRVLGAHIPLIVRPLHGGVGTGLPFRWGLAAPQVELGGGGVSCECTHSTTVAAASSPCGEGMKSPDFTLGEGSRLGGWPLELLALAPHSLAGPPEPSHSRPRGEEGVWQHAPPRAAGI